MSQTQITYNSNATSLNGIDQKALNMATTCLVPGGKMTMKFSGEGYAHTYTASMKNSKLYPQLNITLLKKDGKHFMQSTYDNDANTEEILVFPW
jgi:hypothetical protein